jgi:glycosyltransferase involved in cell wall biosynthesis
MLAPGTGGSVCGDDMEEAEYGLLVSNGNVKNFAKAILRLLDDTQLRARYSRLGLERARHFDPQDMADGYFRVVTDSASR